MVFRDLYNSFLTAVPEGWLDATWKYFAMSGAMSFVSVSCKMSSNYISVTQILRFSTVLLHTTN